MSEMVEHVARAIFDSLYGDTHNTHWGFMPGPTNVDEETKERFRRMARAAIEATGASEEEMAMDIIRRVRT